ncbi:MAG: hypothetical protein JWL59_1417 [Chthoniobacteraceae bacterium]|nr:hypothetical protein [Chthoniobacteraceae bacterium]
MNIPRAFRRGRQIGFCSLLLLFFFAFPGIMMPVHAGLGLNSGSPSDIWAMLYPAAAAAMEADFDGDGHTNAQEAAAGTDPNKADSIIKISSVAMDVYGFNLTFPTLLGKNYQIQTKPTLSAPAWINLPGPQSIGNGGDIIVTIPNPAQNFYRVLVQDIDSDGDGVNDWEELTLGFNPNTSHSGGLDGPDDRTAIAQGLVARNSLSLSATTPLASEAALISGVFTLTRKGGLNAVTAHYSVSGTALQGVDYVALGRTVIFPAGVRTATVTITPMADALLESNESVILSLTPDAAYDLGAPTTAAVLISDAMQAGGDGLRVQFWNEAASGANQISNSNPAKFSGAAALSRVDATVDIDWSASPGAGVNADYFSARWTGEVLPEFSQIYRFYLGMNLAGRVWINGQLLVNNWPGGPDTVSSKEASATIALVGGVRYPIVIETYDTTGTAAAHLSWASANQIKQVIPMARLFSNAPPQILSGTELTLLKGSGPYTYNIAASGYPTAFAAGNLPPGWTLNVVTDAVTGIKTGSLTGSPTQAGFWQIPLSATNASGSGSAILELTVTSTGGAILRELWSGIAGAGIGSIPIGTAPTSTSTLTSLEISQSSPDANNFGDRIRGYITAPQTGAYQFWLTGDDVAELWISNDDERANLFKRATLSAATGFRAWAAGSATPLLWLEVGKRYYIEILHKESAGTDHLSVGWLKPGDSGILPSEVVPGYTLSSYVAPTVIEGQSALYTTNLSSQGGAVTDGSGGASLQLSADQKQAVVTFNYTNLTSPVTGKHVHDGTLQATGNIVFDLDAAMPRADGSYVWDIADVPGINLTAAQIVQHLNGGSLYLNVHTATFPAGEIKGFFKLQAASQTFSVPPPAPAFADDHTDANAAARFLTQATFGPTTADIASVQSLGYSAWIDNQFARPATAHLPVVESKKNRTDPNNPTYSTSLATNAWWQNSITAPDQLRQRLAFALSEVLVLSTSGVLEDRASAVSYYYDTLLNTSFGSFRDLLKAVTLNPAMGVFLDMRGNDKPNLSTGLHPNENYAREIQQLFSIGLYRMHPDGSLILNSKGEAIPTYDQDVIVGFAHAFTGWTYNQADVNGFLPTSFSPGSDYIHPMKAVPSHHFTGQKRILNNVVLPGLTAAAGAPLDPYATHTAAQITDAAYQALASKELDATHDAIFTHPNTAPFICRQLIQRLVTSTPSLGYVYRVAQIFNDNGAGIRGDMKAVVKGILLDYEARSVTARAQQGYGKQREPVLRITSLARAFSPPPAFTGTYTQTGGLISVISSTPTVLQNGNAVYLDFSSDTTSPATGGSFTIRSTPASTPTTFTVRAKDVIAGTYSQAAASTTVTVTTAAAHGLTTGNKVYLDLSGAIGGDPADGLYVITVTDTTHFTVADAGTVPVAARAGSVSTAFFKGGYSQSANSTTVTITTNTTNDLSVGAIVALDFKATTGQPTMPLDGLFPVVSIVDRSSFTVTATTYTSSRSGTLIGASSTPVLNRTGTVSSAYSDWSVGNTDSEIAQTPLRSPTVFNFFVPDYQFPGMLATAGLVTPEFQLTSDTTVMRHSNYLFGGIFSSSSSTSGGDTTGLNSFEDGDGSIALDFSPWMQNGPGAKPWTNNENVSALIDQMNTLLMSGQMPAPMKSIIQAYISNTANLAYNNITPSDANKRDRIRALVHLIVTSPDFAIQK